MKLMRYSWKNGNSRPGKRGRYRSHSHNCVVLVRIGIRGDRFFGPVVDSEFGEAAAGGLVSERGLNSMREHRCSVILGDMLQHRIMNLQAHP